MARKYDLISELYDRTCKTVVSSPQNWEAFLTSACRNYKLRFDEQLLVFAQRPDATAVLEIERWNGTFGRWVNRGATGIAVFDDASGSRQRLIHYFDISDTHPSKYSRPVPIWEMKPEYEQEITETLESTFGTLENSQSLADAVMSAAQNAAEDNLPDYTRDLLYSVNDSFLEELDEDNISSIYRKVVTNSVAYMMMERLGIDTEEYFEREDFEDIINFNTPATLNALGFATSDIAEMGLTEIAKTVMSLERQNRIIAENRKPDYNIGRNQNTERSPQNERADIHDAGRLQTAQPDLAGTTGSADGTVRTDESEVPQREPQGAVLQSSDELHPEQSPDRNRTDGNGNGGTPDEGNGKSRGRDREPESDGYDELGSEDEQYPQQSAGDRVEGSNLRLDYYDRNNEDKSLPFFGNDDTIREILGTTPHLKATKDEIRAFFEANADDNARTSYIKSIFNNDYTEVILRDGRRCGYKTYQNVLQLWEGSFLSRTKQSFYDWGVIAKHFEAMRLLGELSDTMKPLPSIDGQMRLMLDYKAEVTKPSAFSFSQEIIDAVLTRGSGVSEGKLRIYEQFQKSLSKKENVDFLKDEYGWGGSAPVIIGTGIDEMHDGKGIQISKKINGKEEKTLLNWNQVEKRISELIKMDRYLNTKEKERYPEWLEKQEIRRAEVAEERRNREILLAAPAEKKESEPSEDKYEYHLGNTVYLGANEYEILSFDDDRVMLYDTQFPLFNKEMSRDEFDRMVQENPMNDHLKVKVAELEQVSVYDREEKVLYDVLSKLRIDDIDLDYDNDGLVARDYDGNVWHGAEFYHFLIDEVFVFDDNGGIVKIDGQLYDDFNELSEHYGVPVKDNRVKEPYRGYLAVKAENPDNLVLYQVGDFFEAFNDDAKTVAEALDLVVTSRSISDSERVPMVGFPQHTLKTYINMLSDRGYDVTVSALENGERKKYTLTAQNKEDPTESKPIGRIEYLHTDGKVRESIEYTSPYQLEKDIKEENYYGVPMSVILYKQADGTVIPHEYITECDPPLQGFSVIDSPYLEPTTPVVPAWEKQKKNKAQTFDLHPEIPMSERHNFDLAHNEVEEVNKKERFHRNYAAITVLKRCEQENRFATPEEQVILSKYVGWGGIPEVFDERAGAWQTEYAMLKNILTPEEYESARESTLTAFYTPPTVISAVYKAMEQLGFREGNILEPSCGIGHFIGMLPESMKNSKIYGVEIDTVSAGIAQQLYQKSSIAAQGFEEANLPDSFFDAVVGNVPFGDFKVIDKRYDKYKFLIHDYFFAKSLDKLRPGGVMALITSKGTYGHRSESRERHCLHRGGQFRRQRKSKSVCCRTLRNSRLWDSAILK